ncbi:expressed unknown protein [Seminavis robusta]|uniref:Uncharacterized protein n=1 Tax=Seminavis robusta TaxID=568900 RepID=A0A9N8EZ49_9STRA|nr:expressed unknown protein [Seminavis robusta]|eukprot:Sro2045_g312430.1 n/a (741) ;mRNA; f:5661-8010
MKLGPESPIPERTEKNNATETVPAEAWTLHCDAPVDVENGKTRGCESCIPKYCRSPTRNRKLLSPSSKTPQGGGKNAAIVNGRRSSRADAGFAKCFTRRRQDGAWKVDQEKLRENVVALSQGFSVVFLTVLKWARAVRSEYNKSGGSYSPEVYDFLQIFRTTVSTRVLLLSVSLIGLVGTPLVFYNCIPANSPSGFVKAITTFWDGFLLLSSPIAFCGCLLVSFYYANTADDARRRQDDWHRRYKQSASGDCISGFVQFLIHSKKLRFHRLSFGIMYLLVFLVGLIGPWTLILPSWLWHPFLWGRYQVTWPSKLAPAMQGLCIDYSLNEGKNGRLPLCLTKDNWNTLSTGALSSKSSADVEAVLAGISYGKQKSGGIVISILARDVVDFIAPLRQNVESLVPFFSNVVVVVFENDSMDGSREAFKRWGQVVKGYEVDLIECDDAVDCKFGKIHRDDVGDFSHSSAIGDMHKYRQRVVDYVLTKPKYHDFSHMLVLDIDLGVSLSPFGVLHTLGTRPNNPVASAGRQPWPTAFGSLVTPYDFSAFRPYETKKNARLVELQKAFCEIMPPGDRWRNECDALSPIQMIHVLAHDRINSDFVRVGSAFNGAVMYPLKLIRESNAQYDAGDDGQRCEHVGFHLSLNKPMYLNHKWDMHLSPTIPGGPNGHRAQRTASRIFFSAKLASVLQLIHISLTSCFVWSSMTFGAFFLYPLLFRGELRGLLLLKSANKGRRHSSLTGVKTV